MSDTESNDSDSSGGLPPLVASSDDEAPAPADDSSSDEEVVVLPGFPGPPGGGDPHDHMLRMFRELITTMRPPIPTIRDIWCFAVTVLVVAYPGGGLPLGASVLPRSVGVFTTCDHPMR